MSIFAASVRVSALLSLTLLLVGCHYLRSADIPMTAEYFHYHADNTTLVVLLPGLGDEAGNYIEYGTLQQILACRQNANVIGVDSHFGYYRERIIGERLRQDVIEPALAAGISEIWVLGVSLGGLGSLVYRQMYPREVEGVILMAPYLGERDELQAWLSDPQGYRQGSPSDLVDLWEDLEKAQPPNDSITLAYGVDDDFYWQHLWLASRLDETQVVSAPGGHGWKIWQGLWPQALRRSGLCR